MQNPSVKKKRIKIDSSFLKIGQAAQALGVSIDTLRRWEKAGKISTVRTPGGTRLYHISALKEINPAAEPYPIETYQTDSLSTEELLKRVEKDTILGYNDTTETEESISNIPISQYPNIPSRKSSLISKFLIGSAFVSTITLLLTSWITASYLTQPKSAQQFFKNNIASPLFSPFHALAEEVITVIDPRKAKELGFAPPEDPPPVATNYKLRTLDSSVLAVTASSQFLEINSDTQINGALFVRDSVNGLSLEATPSANSFVLGSGDTTLTVTNDALLDQDVSTSASPTFNTLNLSATSNQLVFQSSGSAGGTLTWTPTAARVITLPDATGTVLLDSATQTITNKTINASNNTITNISNSALANSKVTVTAGTNLTGGGDITLGSSATISLKDSISLSGTLTAGGVVKLADGTAAAPGLTFTNDTDTGLYRIGANSIGLITGGSATSGITIDASGNVGIGTISPSYTLDVTGRVNGSTALCIAGDCKTAWSGSAGYTASNGLTLSGVDLQLGGSLTRATGIDISSQNFGFLGGNVGIGTTSAGGSLVVASGNVGIGFTSPDRITQIASDINITPSLASLLGANGTQFAITGSTAANLQKKLTFGLDTSDNYGVIQVGNTSGTAYGLVLNPAGGNVGIGTTNLNARIAGTSAPILRVVKSDGVGGGTIEVQNTTSGGGDSAIDFIDSNGNIRGNIAYYAERSASDPARFVINQGTWLAEITPLNTILNENGGNVGIGTTGPLSLLSVAGNAHIGNLYQSISAPTNGLFVDGNVGIGATTSSNKLDVWGNSRLAGTLTVDSTSTFGGSLTLSSGQFLAPNGTASLPSYSFTNSTSAGMYSPSANALALNTNGASTPPLTITAGGNVGIGITNPGSALTVIGNVGIGTSAAGAALQVNGGGLFGWGTASVAAPANGLAINGNVGIGTTSPAANLEVIPSSNSYLRLFSTTDAPAFQMLGNGDGANYAWFELGRKDSNQDRWQMSMAADGSNRLRFIALPTNSENLSLLPGGNVGIGATLPNAKLSIQGNVGIGYTGVNQAIPVNGLAVFGNVGIGTTTANSNLSISGNAHIGSLYQGISAPTDGLFVDGNVGIGATTSNNKLDVWGNARIAGTLTVDSTITPTGQFLAIDGSKSAPSYSFASSGNSDNGMYLPSANALSFSTAGNDVLTLTAGGNVGIGTTSPSQKLEINGNALLNATRPELQLLTSGTGKGRVAQYAEGAAYLTANLYYDGTNWNRDNTTIAGSVVDISDVIPFRLRYVASGANPATLTESIRINTSGNIGIGLTTANSQLSISNNVHIGSLYQGTVAPTNGLFVDGNVGIGATSTAYNLDVWGTGRFSSGLTVGGNVGIGQSLTVTSGAVLSGGLVVDGGSVVLPAGSIGNSELENSSITVSATAGTGISVSGSPVSLGGTLTVAGIDASTTVKGVASFNSTNFSVSSGAVNTIQDIATTSSPTFVGLSLSSGNLGIGTSATGAKLQVNGGGIFWPSTTSLTGPTNGLAVFGNVGIGTTSPNNKLQVIGAGVFGADYGQYSASANGLLIQGNVGIGATTSSNKLDVWGNARIAGTLTVDSTLTNSSVFRAANGSATAPSYSFTDSTSTGLWSPSTNALSLTTNGSGTSGITIGANGNVGIGVTAPAALLHISNTSDALSTIRLSRSGSSNDWGVYRYGSSGSDRFCVGIYTVNEPFCISTDGNIGIGLTTANSQLSISNNVHIGSLYQGTVAPTNGLFVDGNVGIGATSTAYNLDVWGTGRFSSGLTVGGNVGIGQSLTVTSGAVLSGGLVVDGGSVVLPAGSIGNSELENSSITVSATAGTGISVSGSPVSLGGTLTVAGIDASTTVKGVASFNSTNFSVSSGAVNTIQDIATTSSPTFVGLSLTSGNLGIGTSATGAKLQVNGNGIFWPSTTSLTGPTNGLAVFGNVGIGTTTTSSSLQIAGNAVIGFAPSVAAPTNGLLVNGNVGIGFTSPDRLLQMASDINITGSLASLLGAAGTQFGITGNSGSGGTEKKLALGIDTTDNYGVIQSGNTSGTAYDLSLNPAGGNVGIGTTSPAAPLHILGVEAQLRLQGNGAGQDAAIDFYPFTPAGGAGYRGQILVTHGTDADAGKLNLQLANTSGTLTTRLYIEDGGNVGIGTDTSPDYLLELYDATNTPAFGLSDDDVAHGVTTIANTDTFLHLSSISTTVGGAQITGLADATGVALGLKGIQSSDPTDSTPAIQLIGAKASGTGVQDLGATETILQVANNDDTAALTILGNGNVGIGATIPNATLSIQGNVGIGYTGANQVIPSNGLAVFGNVGIGITTANSNLSISGNAHIGSLYQGISAPTNGLFVDGNVGIGATTSSNKLDVWGNARIAGNLTVDGTLTQNGNISTSGVFLAANGSASAPSYSFTNLTNAGLWTNGDGLLLTTGGSNTSGITVTGGGNIGIGTTAPGTILEVNRGGTGNTNVGRFLAPSIAAGSYAYIAVGAVDSTANGLSIGFTENSTDANTYGWMSVGGDDPTAGKGLIVRSGGNIGIGTTGPGSSLAVSGNGVFGFGGASSIAGPANGLAVFGNVGIGTTSPNSKLSVIGGGVFTNTWGGAIAPSAGLIVEGNTGIGVSAPVQQFQVNPNGSSAFTVTSSGFVGIGKTSPGVRLDILNGTLRLAQDDGDAVNSARLIIDGRGATGVNASIKMYADTATLTPGVLFHNNAGTAIGRIGLDRGTSTVYAGASQDDLVVGTDVSTNKVLLGTNSIVRLTVDTAGNIGIGITTANSTLSVAGSAHIGTIRQGIAAPTNGLFVDGNVGIGATTSSNKLDVWGNAAIVGNLTLTGNLLPATDDTYDLGSDTARWNNLYLGPATLHLGTSTSDEYTLAYDTTNNRLGFNVNGSGPAEIVMDSNGNIGIGTTGPVAKLEISQTSGNSLKIGKADLTDGIIVADESIHFVIDNDNTQADRLFAFDTNGNGVTELMRIQENGNVGIGTASPVGLFQVGSSPTPPLYVASGTGNVGIGTTGPVAKLEVDQTTGDVALFFSTQAANDNAIRFRTNQGDSSIGLVLDNSNTNKAAGMRMQPTTGSLTFNTGLASGGGLTTATEKMQLDTNGNLGIGTQSPIAQLDVRDTGTGTTLHTYIGSGAGQFGILDNGNVGIGTTTPGEALHVVDNNGKGIKIERTSATASSWSWRIQTGGQLQLVQDSGGANDILIQPTAAKSLIINEDSADADLRIESDNSVSAFFLEGSSGNVGIGFTSPPALFSVGSTAQFQVNSSGFALLPAGLASTPSLSFVGDTDTGLWWLGTNFLALTTNGAGALQAGSTINGLSINANGNVGIGTTNPTAALDVAGATSTISNTTGNLTITPASNLLISAGNVGIGFTSPDRKLQIGSDIDITGTAASILGANGAQFSITGSSANTTHKKLTLGIDTTDNYGVIQAGNTNGTAYDLALQPGGGNVGIGTTNPSRLLHIVDASADNNFMMNTYRTSASADIFTTQKARGTLAAPTIVASGDDVIAMTFQGYDGAAFRNVAAIRASIDAAPGSSDMPGRLTFHTTTDGSTTLTERMRIDNTGSVGIGSTSPQAARQLTLNDNGGGQLDLLAFSIAEAEKALIGYDVGGGSLITSTANHLKFTSAGGMIFATGAAVGPTSTSGMYIASAGSVGIGSTSPQADLTILGGTELIDAFDSNNRGLGIYSANLVGRLYVQGEAQADLILVDKGAGVNDKTSQLYNDGGVTTFRSLNDAGGVLNDNILVIDHSTGSVGIGAAPTTGAKLDINGALYIADTSPPGNTTVCYDGAGGSAIGGCSSLRELKTNIQDLNIGLNELMQLRPVSFDWKTGLSNDLGFIAEEVEQIAPILSTYKEDGSLQGIKYNTITALITKAIQEQQAQINNLIAQQDTNSTLLAGLSVNSDGTLNAPEVKTGKLVISSDINLTAPALASLLQTDRSQALLTTNYQLPTTNEVDLLTSLNSISEAVLGFQTQESTTSAKLDDLATKVDSQETRMQSLEEKLASLSAQIATSSAQQSASSSASEATASSLTTNYELPTTNSLDLTPPDILLATQSAQLVNLEVTSDATVSGQLTAYDLDVQNALKSLGTTTLGSTLVAGDLTVDGTMSVTGNSINVIGTLFLQNSPLAEGVDFFNGAVTIDKTGTLAVNKIALPPEVLGEATIPAGSLEIPVFSNAVTEKSKVFLTPITATGGQALIMSEIISGSGFVVSLEKPFSSDIKFNWVILDNR